MFKKIFYNNTFYSTLYYSFFYIFEINKCVVKGYHAFKIRPPFTSPPTRLLVDREYSNIKDVNACLVWLPPLNKFPPHMHDNITDAKRQLKLSDIAGLPIGCLSSHFRDVLDNGGGEYMLK